MTREEIEDRLVAYEVNGGIFFGQAEDSPLKHRPMVRLGRIDPDVKNLVMAAPDLFCCISRLCVSLFSLQKAFETGEIYLVDDDDVADRISRVIDACLVVQMEALEGYETANRKLKEHQIYSRQGGA